MNELIGIMVHAGLGELLLSANNPQLRLTGHLDDMTSHGSTSVYSGDELQKFISYVEQIRSIDGADGYSACVVGQYPALFPYRGYLTTSPGRLMKFFSEHAAPPPYRPESSDDFSQPREDGSTFSVNARLVSAPISPSSKSKTEKGERG